MGMQPRGGLDQRGWERENETLIFPAISPVFPAEIPVSSVGFYVCILFDSRL
jgi:hypothetical protein